VPCAALVAYQLGNGFGHFLRPALPNNQDSEYQIIEGLAV
jgi:hypothetical protein